MIKRCDKKVFVKVLNKDKPCMKDMGHPYQCMADLTGETFGQIKVIKFGERIRSHRRSIVTWVIKQGELIRTTRGDILLAGLAMGKVCVGGYPTSKNGQTTPEYSSVQQHRFNIFSNKRNRSCYKGMPFFDGWNPDKGGSLGAGARWIVENLGKRPGPKWSLDVIEHHKGFVPGNLRWAKKDTQTQNKRHKILGRFTLTEIRTEARRHGYKLVRI